MVGDGRKGRSGKEMMAGVLYASHCRRGSVDTFWQVDEGSLKLHDHKLPDDDVMSVVTEETATEEGSCKDSVSRSKEGSPGMRMESWLHKNPGVVVTVGGPGSRDAVAKLNVYHVYDYGRTMWEESEGLCACAAVVHAINFVRGKEVAETYMGYFKKSRPRVVNLGNLSDLVRRMKHCVPSGNSARVECRRMGKTERTSFNKDAFKWMVNQMGNWLVRLVQVGKVDHCVFVDCSRRLIWDSAEAYPLRLCQDSLRMCGGPSATRLEIREVREVVLQKEKTMETEGVEVIELD